MPNFYTSRIITPSLSSFHDIPGIPSLQQWAEDSVPDPLLLDSSTTPEYPYYSKRPLPVFNNFQYAFAPNATFNFFGYGTEFLNTTAFYEVYDEFSNEAIFRASKYIPPIGDQEAPPTVVTVASAENAANFGGQWYLTVTRQPVDIADFKSCSYVLNTVVVNETLHQTVFTLDINNDIPEIQFVAIYDNTTDALIIQARFDLFATQDATYNFVANYINSPVTDNFSTATYFVCSLNSSNLLYDIPASTDIGGRVLTLVHNGTYGGWIDTKFAKTGINLAQDSLGTFIPGSPSGINVIITDSNQVSCIVPDSGPWSVSGVFIDIFANNSSTPKITLDNNISTTTLLDTITSYANANYTMYGSSTQQQAGSIAAKYDLVINSGDYVENRTTYFNWYKSEINQVDQITTTSVLSSNLFALSAVLNQDTIDVYGVPVGNTNIWNISGYKTDMFYNDINPAFNNLATQTNVLSSSWVGSVQANGAQIGELLTVEVDRINYYPDTENLNLINYSGVWEFILVQPGGELVVKKDFTVIWSDPETNRISYDEQTRLVLDVNNQYPSLSANFNLFASYFTDQVGAPIVLGIRTTVPLEVYGCRYIFSSSAQQLNNTTKTIPFTGSITNIPSAIESYDKIGQFRAGASYDVLVLNNDDPTDISIYAHQQLTTLAEVTGFTTTKLELTPGSSRVFETTANDTEIQFNIIEPAGAVNYYTAGYKLYNNSTTFAPLFTSNANAFTRTVEVSSFTLDSVSVFEGYDAMWNINMRSKNRDASKIQKISTVFNNFEEIQSSVMTIAADIVNSQQLSSVNCFVQLDNSTVNLLVTADPIDLAALQNIEVAVTKTGITSPYCIRDTITPSVPSVPEAEVQYTFTYPGTYSVYVSAVSGDGPFTVTSVLSNQDNYFKIIDIPPLVNFDITSNPPSLSNYIAKQGSANTELSYYKPNTTFNTLTTFQAYINTWTTAPGSFQIEAIWLDYGDGSEIEKIYRTRDLSTNPENLAFNVVKNDPRNHIFSHVYTIPDYGEYTYNVSVTAFSQNTNTYSTGYKTLSSFAPAKTTKKYLVSNALLDDGTVIYNMQFDNDSAKYPYNPVNISNIQYQDSRYYNISA